MSLFIRLSTVAAIASLLRCVSATVVITAPSTATDNTAGLETREQGPTAWICSALAVDSPWTSYANIRGYLEGGNAEKKDYSDLVLYPVMELFHASESRLCVYLPAEDHCYPPAPSTDQVKAVKQLSKRNYYAIRFWGQASDARVQYYRQKLTAALNTQSKAANFDLFFVSFFNDHVREVRYDPTTTGEKKSAEPLQVYKSRLFTCTAAPGYNISSTTMQVAGQEYFHTTLPENRLNLSDVQTKVMNGSNIQSQDACGSAASSGGQNAFSFVNGACKVYDFGKPFCPCIPGDFDIYINTKLLGESKNLTSTQLEKGVKKMVIYTEISLDQGYEPSGSLVSLKNRSQCDKELGASSNHSGAFVVNDVCSLSALHDFANCNQICRGKPVDVLVKIVDPFPKRPILPLCGQEIIVPMIDKAESTHTYVSHAGFGCYRYQEAKNEEEEDCIVSFKKNKNAKVLQVFLRHIALNSEGITCHDVLLIKNELPTMFPSKPVYNGCSGTISFTAKEGITIKFHRGRVSSEKNIGFKLDIKNRI